MSEFNLKKYLSNNPLLTEGKVEDYAKMILSAAKGLDDPLKSAIDLIGNYRDNPSELPKEIDKGFFVSNYVDIIFALEDQYRKMNEGKEVNEIELKYRSEDYIFDYIANDLFREKYGRTISFDELTDEEKDRVENSYDSYVDEEEPSGFYDQGMGVDESINEELDLVHVYDKNNKKIIGTGRVVQPEKDNPYSVIVQFDRDLILSFPRDRVKPVKEEVEVNEGLMDDIFGGIPYKTVGVVSFTTVELPDDAKERIIMRAKEAGKFAQPNVAGGVTVRDEAALNEEEELTFTPSSGTKAGGTFSLNNRKYELTSPIKNVTIGGRYVTTLPKGTILYNLAGGLLADHESLRKFETNFNQYYDKSNYSGIMIRKDKEVLQNIIDNSKVLEFYES